MTAAHATPPQPAPQVPSGPASSSQAKPAPLHLRLRPETGVLPRGWLAELRARYEEGPEGFVAIGREQTEGLEALSVLGCGIDRLSALRAAERLPANGQAARAAAQRSNRDPDTLLVHPCTARLREEILRRKEEGGEEQVVRTDVFEGVAYAERGLSLSRCAGHLPASEATPETVVDTWLEEHGILKAHGEACEGGIADWDETVSLVTAMAYAYVNAHPAGAMTSDALAGRRSEIGTPRGARLGWTRSAKMKRETEAGETVVALSGDLDEARAEVRENL